MEFDSTKSLEENLAIFRTACDELDPDCAKILFDNLSKLQSTGEAARDRAARAAFNASVKAALVALPDEAAS